MKFQQIRKMCSFDFVLFSLGILGKLTHWPLGGLDKILDKGFLTILVIDGWGISCETAVIRLSLDVSEDKSKLVQVMAWCHQATSHYLSQC